MNLIMKQKVIPKHLKDEFIKRFTDNGGIATATTEEIENFIKENSTSNKRCSIDGVEFESAKAAADFLNMNEFSIRWILQGRGRSQKHKEKYKNWYYIN